MKPIGTLVTWISVFVILCSIASLFHPDSPGRNQTLFVLLALAATAWFWGGYFVTRSFLRSLEARQPKEAPRQKTDASRSSDEYWASVRRDREEKAKRTREVEAAESQRREELARERAERERLQQEFERVADASLVALTEIPAALLNAEELLDAAETDFRESAFSPFWDSIEAAVNKLGFATSKLRVIEQSASRYNELLPSIDGPPRPFPVDVEAARGLVVANNTAKRLQAIVRSAQRDFQFATIYEQRKTNQILVSGFRDFGAAIAGLGFHVSESLAKVAERVSQVDGSIQSMNADLTDSLRKGRDLDVRIAIVQAEQAHEHAAEQAEAAKKGLAILDNIQRGRVPRPFEDTP
jgi:hypothetical protein